MNKKNLKMGPVGPEYMEQYNALLRYVFQVTDQELNSPSPESVGPSRWLV